MRFRRATKGGLTLAISLAMITGLAAQVWSKPPVQEDQKSGGGGASAQSDSGDPLDDIEAGADDPIAGFAPVSSAVAPPLGRSCPPTWLFFANPIHPYDVCYPATWGFNDGSTSSPLLTIPGPQLYGGVQLLSPTAFPWTVGDRFMEGVVSKNAVSLGFRLLMPHVSLDGCAPATPIAVVGGTGTWCSESGSITDGYFQLNPLGNIRVAKFAIPLPTDPTSPSTEENTAGYDLVIYAMTSQAGWTSLSSTVLQIVNNLRPL